MGSNNFSRSQKLQDISQRFRQSNYIQPLINNQPETHKKPNNRSAVLICLFEERDEIYVILTKRSSKLSSYSGHVSLPGGRTDEGDVDDIRTALREAEEEIGLDPALVDVVAVLEPFSTKLIQNENRRQEEREFQGDKYLFHYFDFETNNKVYVIWALTAVILTSTASLVYQRPPDFQLRIPKFWKKNYSKL